MENNKYFTVETILARLNSQHPDKSSQFSIGQIVSMCAEIELEVISSYIQFIEFSDVEIVVADGKAFLPCNLHRLLHVSKYHHYYNDGKKLSFHKLVPANGEKIKIDYLGIPIDEDSGFPLFLKGHEQALYWGCLKRMYESDFFKGNLHPNIWYDIKDSYENALNSANTGFKHRSFDDLMEAQKMITNPIQKLLW